MFNLSNYYEQSRGLPAENDYQLILLKMTDASTLGRETAKIAALIGFVGSVSGVIFNFDPMKPLYWTMAFGASWLIARACAHKLEPQAEDMIRHFKELRNEEPYKNWRQE